MAQDYDRHARLYDRLIGNRVYNRVFWGTRPEQYAAFAREALAAGEGPFLDAGCGTAVFTADVYRGTSRPLVLVDRSAGMLDKARERLDGAAAELVQADLHDLPFGPGGFDTIGCFAMLHVLDEPWQVLAALRDQLAPGGRLFASMLVTDRGGISGPYMRALRSRGELGPPRSEAELASVARDLLGPSAQVTRTGSMAWLRT